MMKRNKGSTSKKFYQGFVRIFVREKVYLNKGSQYENPHWSS